MLPNQDLIIRRPNFLIGHRAHVPLLEHQWVVTVVLIAHTSVVRIEVHASVPPTKLLPTHHGPNSEDLARAKELGNHEDRQHYRNTEERKLNFVKSRLHQNVTRGIMS